MVLKLILLSAGSKTRLLHNFVSELSLINPDFQIHVLDSKPPARFDDKRVFFHYLNPSMWNSSKSMYESIAPYNADIILPTRNGELSLLSKMSDEIKELKGKVVISSNDEVLSCTDKYALANSGRYDDRLFIDTFNTFQPIASDRIVIKERFGAGSKGLVICEKKRINQDLIEKFQEPVYQNFVSGREFSADLYFTKSSLIHARSLRFRDKTIDGESTQSTFFSNEAILNSLNSLFQNSKFRGPINVQGFLLENGKFTFFDINPRIGGAFFMTRFNGFELSKWIVQEYFESSTPDSFSSQNFSGVVIRNEMQYEVQ